MRVVQACIRPFTLVQQGLTRAIVNPETLSTQCFTVTPTTEDMRAPTGYQAAVELPFDDLIGTIPIDWDRGNFKTL
ncbi:uncharacterized protein METZ01_LOCUS158318, partial [marine metagenome]